MEGKKEINSKPPIDEMLPELKQSESRLNALYSIFRPVAVNPLDWECKFKFWRPLIEKWSYKTNQPVFTLAELTEAFVLGGRRSLCLSVVISETIRSGDACKLSDFESGWVSGVESAGLMSWAGWAADKLVKKPLVWTFNKLWYGEQPKDPPIVKIPPDQPIIFLPVLKKIADKIVDANKGELMAEDDLLEYAGSKENLRLALILLQRQGRAIVTTYCHRKLVKLACEKQQLEGAVPAVPKDLTISEKETATYMLRKDELAIQHNIEKLEEEKSRLQEEARAYLKKGMRQLAKNCLKKRHAYERCIEKRIQALENVQTLLHRVMDAEADGQIFDSYKKGLTILKKTLSEAGLTEDNVENAKADLEEVLDLQDDLSSTLANIGNYGLVEGEEKELEDELAEILSQPEPTAAIVEDDLKIKEKPDEKWDENLDRRLKSLTVNDLPIPPNEPLTSSTDKVKSRILVTEGQ